MAMSRIDLKGFGGGHLPPNDDFDDFDFGPLPDDDEDLDGEQLEEENIDAVNNETFGVGVDDGILDDDLEQYSKQTAGLHLDDEMPKWLDEPTCSISAPNPSDIPAPPFGYDSVPSANASSSSYGENLSAFKMQLGTTDSLWKNVDATTSLGWSEPELSTLQKSVYDLASRPDVNGTAFLGNYNFPPERSPTKNDGIRPLAAIPKDALTLEEIERIHASKTAKPAAPSIPPLPSEGAVTLAELERRLLLESSNRATLPTPGAERPATVLPPLEPRVPQLMNAPPPPPPAPAPPPPPPYLPFPMLPPFASQIIRAHLLGHLPELPPGFPPITPQMRAAILALGPPPVPRMPSHAMPPPFRFMQQPSHSRPTRPPLPPHLLYPPQTQMHPHLPPSMHHSRSYNRDRLSKRAGLPSNKTISDFALSPFAGFVSKKEREWLIKIQQLQCQGCGNPYEDDFYYTIWKQRKTAVERRKKGLKPEDEECDCSVNPTNPHHYIPPTFAGSLGKPTLSTVNYPRHLIDLSSDSTDDEDKLSMKSSTSQKKLRALLLQLENVALLVIECDDRQRVLCAPSLSDELQAELKEGIECRMKTIIESICSNERLETVLLINKGRQMFARTLTLASEEQQLFLLKCFFCALGFAGRRVRANEMNESLLLPIFETFSRFSNSILTDFIQNMKLASDVDATANQFVTNLFVLLLLCCARKDCHLDTNFYDTTLASLLRPPRTKTMEFTLDQYITLTSADVNVLNDWSTYNIAGYRGSFAEKLIQNLKLTCGLHDGWDTE